MITSKSVVFFVSLDLNHLFLLVIQTLINEIVDKMVVPEIVDPLRDERVMEQDAMLTDIGDLDEFVNLKL